jgi:hypothetical protein
MYQIQITAIHPLYNNPMTEDNLKSFEDELGVPLSVTHFPAANISIANAEVDEATYQKLNAANAFNEVDIAIMDSSDDPLAFFLGITVVDTVNNNIVHGFIE